MATFEAQVEGLTSLSIDGSSAPTQTELTQFLTDGAKEVINHLPSNLLMICCANQDFTSVVVNSEAEEVDTGKIFAVFAGTHEARKISSNAKHRANDSTSVEYATSTDPVYYFQNSFLNVLPSGETCKYEEVQYPAVAYGDSSISSFPDEAEYLIPLYASCKALQNAMGAMQASIVHSDQAGGYSAITSLSQGWENVRFWLENEEDTEMSQATIASLGGELQQFVTEYQWHQGQYQALKQDYGQGLAALKGGGQK